MKTLVLNSNYQPISFVSDIRAICYLLKDKVDVISSWDDYLYWSSGKIKVPSIVRLKYYVRWVPKRGCSRSGIFRRDGNICQYCGRFFHESNLTIDHVIPKSSGGKLSWSNAVTSCFPCNSKKADRPLEKSGLVLLNTPKPPRSLIHNEYSMMRYTHPDWDMYFK
jgi:5-methylcytosine-specific restriction endonuclease McrA